MTRATVVLFDVDSTLITCGGAGRRAIEAAFSELFGRGDVCDFPFCGGTDRAIVRRGLVNAGIEPREPDIDAVLERYLQHLAARVAESARYAVLPGVPQLLARLRGRRGLAIGLGTGNVERGARAKLAPAGLNPHFAFGGFGCDHEERPRLLESGAQRGAASLGVPRAEVRVVVIGDTPLDVRAAHAIGAECIAVCTGGHAAAALREERPALVVDDLTDAAAFDHVLGARAI